MPGAGKKRLRIATYNINGINSRLDVLLRWLREFLPDVAGGGLCLDRPDPAPMWVEINA